MSVLIHKNSFQVTLCCFPGVLEGPGQDEGAISKGMS